MNKTSSVHQHSLTVSISTTLAVKYIEIRDVYKRLMLNICGCVLKISCIYCHSIIFKRILR